MFVSCSNVRSMREFVLSTARSPSPEAHWRCSTNMLWMIESRETKIDNLSGLNYACAPPDSSLSEPCTFLILQAPRNCMLAWLPASPSSCSSFCCTLQNYQLFFLGPFFFFRFSNTPSLLVLLIVWKLILLSLIGFSMELIVGMP